MKRAILVASVCLSISSSRALAVDWSANASLSETTELNDNQFLRSELARRNVGFLQHDHRQRFGKNPDVAVRFERRFYLQQILGARH